nr:universal stress protein [Zoogloeaceae bacterium]
MYAHLLVPLDGSELASNLLTQAVDFAHSIGARITFFTAREDVGGSGDGALLRTLAPDAFAEIAAGEASAILAKALAAAGAVGLACEGVVRTGVQPYALILEVAAERKCDLIFMASHGRRGLKAMVLGSQTQKVLAHSTLPVLVASVESNMACSAAESAIAIIKDEHRAIAAVTNGLRRLAAELRQGATAPDLDFLASMIHYIRAFPEAQHHPKEEQYLFNLLARRTGETDELIATLEQQHREGAQAIAEIESLIANARQGDDCLGALGDAVERFTDGQWHHLTAEEKLILPAARRHLSEEDWREIDAAFRQNGDIRVGGERDEAFKALFVRLMNLAS